MNKYATVQDIVTRLTADRSLRTFFTLYLMAETEAEKTAISARFRKDANALDSQNRTALFAAFAASFKKLPDLAGDLLETVQAANREAALATA